MANQRTTRLALLLVSLALVACGASVKYPGYEYVRIEHSKPNEQCQYKVQESCPVTAMEGCYNWYKKRATTFDANVVHITEYRLADYYHCPE